MRTVETSPLDDEELSRIDRCWRAANHRHWIRSHGEDLPEVRDWRWPQ